MKREILLIIVIFVAVVVAAQTVASFVTWTLKPVHHALQQVGK